MSINDTVKSIHRLALLSGAPPEDRRLSIVLTPHQLGLPASPDDANMGSWWAQTYLGKGQWGSVVGTGPTPESAISQLHVELLNAHLKADERREQVLKAAQAIPWVSQKPQP